MSQDAARRGLDREPSSRAVPYVCPFCGEQDLRPVEDGGWHCRSCLRVFSIGFHGLRPFTPTGDAPVTGSRSETR